MFDGFTGIPFTSYATLHSVTKSEEGMATNEHPDLVQPGAEQAALRGVLALLVDERERRIQGEKGTTKTELLLDRAGVPIDQIAAVMGKKPDAVRKAISRGKAT
jgi:hypothetical protein